MVDWQLFGPPTFLTQQSSWYALLLLNTHDSGSFYNPSPTYNPKIVLRETRNDNPQLGFGFSAPKMHNPSPCPGDIMRWLVKSMPGGWLAFISRNLLFLPRFVFTISLL